MSAMHNLGSSRRSAWAVARSEADEQPNALRCFSLRAGYSSGQTEGLLLDVDDTEAPLLSWVDPFAVELTPDESAILRPEV